MKTVKNLEIPTARCAALLINNTHMGDTETKDKNRQHSQHIKLNSRQQKQALRNWNLQSKISIRFLIFSLPVI